MRGGDRPLSSGELTDRAPVVPVVEFLASPGAGHVTGQVHVNGGAYAGG